MKRIRLIALTIAASVMFAGVASAVPLLSFDLVGVNVAAGAFPSTQTYIPPLPILGGGDIDEAAGTYNLTLSNYSVVIDLTTLSVGPDAQIDVAGWGQTGTFAGGVGGAVTSSSATGTNTCTIINATWGGVVCAGVLPAVAAWPPTGAAGPLGAAGAVIDIVNDTITVTEPFDANGGQVQLVYSYVVPEPGTALLLGGGLVGIWVAGRKRR